MRGRVDVAFPDFPRVKAEARRLVDRAVRQHITASSPVLADIGHTRIHEGRAAQLTRADASTDDIRFRRATATIQIPREQMRRVTVEQLIAHVRDMAAQLADQQTAMLFERVTEAVESVGNVVSAAEMGARAAFLEMERRIEVDFDPVTLEPNERVMVIHPSQAEAWKARWEEWERDPEFTAELARIREAQLQAWRAREDRRRLAD